MTANPILPGCASSHEAQCVKKLTGDIRDGEWLKTLVRDANVTQLVHLAAVLMPFCEQRTVEGACPRCLCEFGNRARTGWLFGLTERFSNNRLYKNIINRSSEL
jgi:hypothetical protein